MAKYHYKLKNGKTLTLEGDTQPDDSDVETAAKEQGVELMPVEAEKPSTSAPKFATQGMMLPETTDMKPFEGTRTERFLQAPLEGIGERLGEMGSGMVALPGALIHDPVGTVAGIPGGIYDSAKETLSELNPFDTNGHKLGRAAVDIASMAPVVKGLSSAAMETGAVRGARSAAANVLRHPAAEVATSAADFSNNPLATIMRRGEGPISRTRNALAAMMDPGPDKSVTRFGAVNSKYTPPSFSGGGAVDTAAEPLQTDVQALVDRYMPNSTSADEPRNPVAGMDLGQSARDILSPHAQSMMDAMHAEANPIFKRMQADGQFDRTNMPASGTDSELISWMRGEGKVPYASPSEPLPPNPNAGGRLVRPSPPPIDLGPTGPDSVSLPEQPQPTVIMSPKARQVANMRSTSQLDSLENTMRMREQGAAAQRYSPDLKVVDESAPDTTATVTPTAAKTMFDQMQENLKAIPSHGDQEVSVKSGETVMKHKTSTPKPQAPPPTEDLWTKTDADLYKELAGKSFKTQHEWQIFDHLDRIMKMRASAMGRGYAAGAE